MNRVGKRGYSDTSLGGEARAFPSTQGSWLSDLAQSGAGPKARALEELARRYWKPIYRYIRLVGTKSNEEAKDLTQDFLLWLLQGGALEGYSSGKGRFRPYLKLILKRFLGHGEEARRRLKRGGGARPLPLEEVARLGDGLPDPRGADPEREFDRAWAREVAEQAVGRVRSRLERQGKAWRFEVYRSIDLRETKEPPTYRDLARRLGMKENDVRNYLRDVRAMIREEIRGDLAETLGRASDLEAEWNELFGG